MAKRKKTANKKRKKGQKYAEIIRVRLGSRIPVYLPQRITPELTAILSNFRKQAQAIGVRQFVIQTHFVSPLEITPETLRGIKLLLSAGWTVTNQMVFTTAGSRRGHSAKLRKVLNEIGVLNYYTFSVKGYMENSFNFATNERAVQEQMEEKNRGQIPKEYDKRIQSFPEKTTELAKEISQILVEADIPFLGTDRNVLNLPGIGKSLTFRTIGITRYGRRVLEFDLDNNRRHSPMMHQKDKVIIIESKSISEYLQQLYELGEDISEYESIWGYSIGETEPRMSLYEYPPFDFEVTEEYTNISS